MKPMLRNTVPITLAAWCVLTSGARAFDPPTDTAGPPSVRIEGPEVVTKIEQPLPVRVVIENKGANPVEGTLEVQMVRGLGSERR